MTRKDKAWRRIGVTLQTKATVGFFFGSVGRQSEEGTPLNAVLMTALGWGFLGG